MLACEISTDLFLRQEVGAIALASQAQAMSGNVGLPRRRKGKEQMERCVVPLASRASECMRHQLNSAPDVVPTHTQVRRAGCCLWKKAGTFWDTSWPCTHPVEVTRGRAIDDAKVRTTRSALLFSAPVHQARGALKARFSLFLSLGWQSCVSPLAMTL